MRKICIFTGTRAEYGLLKPLMEEIKKDKELELQIVVSGMHLSPEFGLTYKEIERDGFNIDEKIEILLSSDTREGMTKSVGLGIISFSEALKRLKPDISVVLGDRFEAFAFASASYLMGIPVAHINGGEITQGALDDNLRHAITKLSYLHFTSTEEYRKRVIQMGEEPERVFNVGSLNLSAIRMLKLYSKEEVEKILNIKFREINFLITFHPVTNEYGNSVAYLKELLKALEDFKDALLIFTKANADPEGRKINEEIEKFVRKNKERAYFFDNLGNRLYYSVMKHSSAVIGNSSSGILEAPFLGVPTVNIGSRQEGRIKPESVIDCKPDYESIKKAILKAISKDFREKIKNIKNPYGDGTAHVKIKQILKEFPLNRIKRFYDISLYEGK